MKDMGNADNGKGKTRVRTLLLIGITAALVLAFVLAFYQIHSTRPGESDSPGLEPPEQNAGPSVFSRLEIDTVSCLDGQVKIEGVTDLPDSSHLIVDFDVYSPESESDTAVSGDATVLKGRFSVDVAPPDTPAFARGPYTVAVLFSPRVQPKKVLDLTGKNGENLIGVCVKEMFGFRTLEAAERVELDLSSGAVWRRGETRI